jgi:hypothetical protein
MNIFKLEEEEEEKILDASTKTMNKLDIVNIFRLIFTDRR